MSHIITIHSFGHGAGRSTLIANLGALLARAGYRVGIMDANFHAPSMQLFFGLQKGELGKTLNTYIWGKCTLKEATYDVSGRLGIQPPGCLLLAPASSAVGEIMLILRESYNLDVLSEAVRSMDENFGLDYLLLDTTSGLTEISLLSTALSDTLITVLRPEAYDYQGVAVSTEVARKLQVPQVLLVLNAAPESLDLVQAQAELVECYQCPVGTVLPYSESLAVEGSHGLLVIDQPDSLFARRLQLLAGYLGVPAAGGKPAAAPPQSALD